MLLITLFLVQRKLKAPRLYQVSLFEREDGVRLWPLLDQNLGEESWILGVPFESRVLLAIDAVLTSSPLDSPLGLKIVKNFVEIL